MQVVCGFSADSSISDAAPVIRGGDEFTGGEWLGGLVLLCLQSKVDRPAVRTFFITLFSVNCREANACLLARSEQILTTYADD